MANVVVTGFDSAYLDRGKTMVESLMENGYTDRVVIADLFEELRDDFLCFPQVNVIRPQSMSEELRNKLWSLCDENHSRAEVFFSMMPSVIHEFLSKSGSGDRVAYLDADLFFCDNFSTFLASTNSGATLVTHGHLPWNRRRLSKYGNCNVAMVVFSADNEGDLLSRYWADATQLWCKDEALEGLYADQAYLDFFSLISDHVTVIEDPRLNVAPWNSFSRKISFRTGRPTIDGDPMLFAHMQGIRLVHRTWLPLEYRYFSPIRKGMKELYARYVYELEKNNSSLFIPREINRGQSPSRALVGLLKFFRQTVKGRQR